MTASPRAARTRPEPRGRHEDIGPTAHYTAYVWRRLGLPYAELFATPRGATLYWGARLGGEWMTELSRRMPSMWQYLGHRHLLIDAQLEALEPDRVIELGAGLSRRGTTWAADRGVDYVEVDLPHMIEAKRAALERAPSQLRARLASRLTLTSRDILAPEFAGELTGLVAGAERPVIIMEGVLMYFPFEDRERILDAISKALRRAGAGAFLCDLQTRAREPEAGPAPQLLRRAIKTVTRGRGVASPWEDWTHVERFFHARGFDDVRELAAHDFFDRAPRLSRMRSPSSIVCAAVGAPDTSTSA